MQKMARAAGRTNNVDQCATTCHAPTVAGLAAAFGSGAMTNSIGEIKDVQTLFLIGANPTEAHPIIGLEMKKALRQRREADRLRPAQDLDGAARRRPHSAHARARTTSSSTR